MRVTQNWGGKQTNRLNVLVLVFRKLLDDLGIYLGIDLKFHIF